MSSLMAVGHVHHTLVNLQKRSRAGLLLETAEAREVRTAGAVGLACGLLAQCTDSQVACCLGRMTRKASHSFSLLPPSL